MNNFKSLIVKILTILKKGEVKFLPGEIAFSLILSLVPLITMIGFGASLFNVSLVDIITSFSRVLPDEVTSFLLNNLSSPEFSGNALFFMVVAIFLASNGINSLILVADSIYEHEHEHGNLIQRRIKAILLTIVFVTLIIFMLLVPIFGDNIINVITNFEIISPLSGEISLLYVIAKWPMTILFIFITIKIIYIMVPTQKIKSSETTNGALFTTFSWFIATILFAYYANNLSSYDMFYGSLSSLIVLFLWVYLISYILVIGLTINAGIYHREK